MSIRKINSGIQLNHKNDIQELRKQFPKGFDFFFIPSVFSLNNNAESFCYITDTNMEEHIKDLLCNPNSSMSFLLGERHTGKSILLKHCLNMSANEIRIEKTLLYSTYFFNEYYLNYEHSFSIGSRISAICSKLEKEFPALSEYFFSELGIEQFYDFLCNTNVDILQYVKDEEVSTPKTSDQKLIFLNNVCKNNFDVYELLKLHFLLGSAICPVNKFIMCIDNIDTLPQTQIEKIICSFVEVFKQLNFISYTKTTKQYTINLLISITPDSYRSLSEVRKQQNWPFCNVIIKNSSIDLEKYFSKKMQYYSRRLNSQNLDAWKKCQQQFGRICQRFDGKYDSMIKNLTFNNVEESMKLYAQILCNKKWARQGKRDYTNEWFESDAYVLNNISVIRTIACGENEIFVNDPDGYISSILYNVYDETTNTIKDYSILCLYIISYFIKHNNEAGTYGTEYFTLKNIVFAFKDVFPTIVNVEKDINNTILYLYHHKILMKSYKDIADRKVYGEQDYLSENCKLYLSSKGKELWNMLQSDSVLMELCREDYYRSYDSEGCHNNKFSSYILMQTHQQKELFIDLCRIVSNLVELENKYIESARNNLTIDMINELFGEHMMCFYLMEGIRKSMEYSGLIQDGDVSNAVHNIYEHII